MNYKAVCGPKCELSLSKGYAATALKRWLGALGIDGTEAAFVPMLTKMKRSNLDIIVFTFLNFKSDGFWFEHPLENSKSCL